MQNRSGDVKGVSKWTRSTLVYWQGHTEIRTKSDLRTKPSVYILLYVHLFIYLFVDWLIYVFIYLFIDMYMHVVGACLSMYRLHTRCQPWNFLPSKRRKPWPLEMQSTCLGAAMKGMIFLAKRSCYIEDVTILVGWKNSHVGSHDTSWKETKHQDSKRCSSLQMICGSGSGSQPITLRSKSSTSSYRAPCFLRSLGWLDWDKFDSAPIIYSALTPEDMDTKFQKRRQTPKTLTHVNMSTLD